MAEVNSGVRTGIMCTTPCCAVAVRTRQASFSYRNKKLSDEECKHSLLNLPSQFGPVNTAGHVHW